MPDKKQVTLSFDGKVRDQLERLKNKTTASTYAEVVRRGLDLLEKEVKEG